MPIVAPQCPIPLLPRLGEKIPSGGHRHFPSKNRWLDEMRLNIDVGQQPVFDVQDSWNRPSRLLRVVCFGPGSNLAFHDEARIVYVHFNPKGIQLGGAAQGAFDCLSHFIGVSCSSRRAQPDVIFDASDSRYAGQGSYGLQALDVIVDLPPANWNLPFPLRLFFASPR